MRSIIPRRSEKPISGPGRSSNREGIEMKKLLAKGREKVGRALLISVIIFIGIVSC
jgi:hypothetical protein